MIPLLESLLGFCVGALLFFTAIGESITREWQPELVLNATILEVLGEDVLVRTESGQRYQLTLDTALVFHTHWQKTNGPDRLSVTTGTLESSDSTTVVFALDQQGHRIVRAIVPYQTNP